MMRFITINHKGRKMLISRNVRAHRRAHEAFLRDFAQHAAEHLMHEISEHLEDPNGA